MYDVRSSMGCPMISRSKGSEDGEDGIIEEGI